MNGRTPQQLQSLLENHFNLSELRQLAFALDIDHEKLEGNTQPDFILSLIKYTQRHDLIEELDELVENGKPVRRQITRESFWGRMNFSTKITIVSVIVTIIGIIVTLITFFPEVLSIGNPTAVAPTPADTFLLQVQVNSAEDQSSIGNATVRLDVAGQLFAPQHTDSNGRAIFTLPEDVGGDLAKLTTEYADFEIESQNIRLKTEPMLIEVQLKPLP